MSDFKEFENLKKYTTFRVGGNARYFFVLKNLEDLEKVLEKQKQANLPIFVLGGGSNIIVSDSDLNCIALKNEIAGIEILKETSDQVFISVGAGESWDGFVKYCVDNGFSGVEALSAIPGTVGGAPIQNIGAYGSEVSKTTQSVEVFDLVENNFKVISNKDCEFAYRDSIFKKNKNRFIVLKVNFALLKSALAKVPDYPGVKDFLNEEKVNIGEIRETIIKIRASKLPDPSLIHNVGSFFKNTIVKESFFNDLKNKFPDIKSFKESEGYIKIPTGWLIEKAGLKGKSFGEISIYEKNAMVLVNKGGASSQDVVNVSNKIKDIVKEKFGVEIEPEPGFVKF
jgi:UDP-N-acetylmuramate dehydrogenase